MRRSVRQRPRAPERTIEMNDSGKHILLRVIILILAIVVAIGAFTYAIVNIISRGVGWREIQDTTSDFSTCAGDFTFMYYIESNAEYKAVAAVYTAAAESAYKLFNTEQSYGDVCSVHYINSNPNREIQVDAALYNAFELVQSQGLRNLYLAPVYEKYERIFYAATELSAEGYDPDFNPEKASEIAETVAYTNNPEDVSLELLGDNRVILHVSDRYVQYAAKKEINKYIDFFWMKNAFVIDYIAKQLIQSGYTHGYIASFDGFVRNLDTQGDSYTLNLHSVSGRAFYIAAEIQYEGAASIVSMRNFMIDEESEFPFYYTYRKTGRCVTSYIDPKDGKDKSANANLIALAHGNESSCAELLVKMIPVYITDEKLTPSAIGLLMDEYRISAVYSDGNAVYCNDPDLTFVNTYDGLTVKTVE